MALWLVQAGVPGRCFPPLLSYKTPEFLQVSFLIPMCRPRDGRLVAGPPDWVALRCAWVSRGSWQDGRCEEERSRTGV